jgi:hypothetical protein
MKSSISRSAADQHYLEEGASCKTVGRGALETSYDVNRTEQDSACLILAVAAIFPRIWTQTHTSSVSAGVGFDRRSCTSRVRNYVINRIS